MWTIIISCVVGVIVVGMSSWVYQWRNPSCKGVLPPGSMGLPIIGETLSYFSTNSKQGIPPYIAKKIARYGTLFKTSLLGQKVIISADPEISYYVFQQEDKLFQCWYTKSALELSGNQGIMGNAGAVHKYLRSVILKLIGSENLKANLISQVDFITRQHLQRLAKHGKVEAKESITTMLVIFIAEKLLGCNEQDALKLKGYYSAFIKGFLSFPINLPGTAYRASLKGRNSAIKMIKDIFKERRSLMGKPNEQKDFLGYLLEEVDNEQTLLTEGTALDIVFLVIFAAYETTSTSMSLLLKHLVDHPNVLKQLKKEHESIRRNRKDKDAPISWTEYKSMTFTHKVINETVRLANVALGIFRKVLKDVEIKGYTIPQGWTIVVFLPSVHLDPNTYENPLEFNPWRWKDEELHTASKKFMAYGGGVRMCVGAELSKVQTAIFLHYLLNEYRWNLVNEPEIIRQPYLHFKNGMHIQLDEIQKEI